MKKHFIYEMLQAVDKVDSLERNVSISIFSIAENRTVYDR